jgi:hypothetical protein
MRRTVLLVLLAFTLVGANFWLWKAWNDDSTLSSRQLHQERHHTRGTSSTSPQRRTQRASAKLAAAAVPAPASTALSASRDHGDEGAWDRDCARLRCPTHSIAISVHSGHKADVFPRICVNVSSETK